MLNLQGFQGTPRGAVQKISVWRRFLQARAESGLRDLEAVQTPRYPAGRYRAWRAADQRLPPLLAEA